MKKNDKLFERRKARNRWAIKSKANGKLRLSVYFSNKNIYAQVIDDLKHHTVVAVSSLEKDLKIAKPWNKEGAERVGQEIARRAIKAGIEQVVFDRGGLVYHGRVALLADAARHEGLKF